MKEEWRDIIGYEGIYQVSSYGNVRSLNYNHTKKSHTLNSTPSNCGYYKVELYKNKKSKIKYVHRLVAEAFLPNPDNKPQVNHIDGNKSNNYLNNLEWSSRSENQRHAITLGLRIDSPMRGRKGKQSPCSKPIAQYTLDGKFIRNWVSTAEAARSLNVNPCIISSCVNGIHKSSCGFIWKPL